jgi:hypothetical protein
VIFKTSFLQPANSWRFIRNVLVKALALFALFNLVFAWWYPLPALGKISAYNRLFPGRERLPYSENPSKAYSLSLYNLEAMFNSHELAAGDKPPQEYRVILIGDSSTWGFLLPAEHTLSAYLNAADIHLPDGRRLRAYNLGYPVMSLTKDLLILSYALRHEPDLIIWPLTLESFPDDKQLFHPLLQNNPNEVRALIEAYGLQINPLAPEFVDRTFQERTLVGARRSLAGLLRLQLYGVMWAATRIDQDIPETYTPRMEDLPADELFHDLAPPHLDSQDLAVDVLAAAERMVGDVPLLMINEPMFISHGENSDIRYNFFYPRWAYDDYRAWMQSQSAAQDWNYYDMWDAVPSSEFTNSAVHLTPKGNQIFAQKVIEAILETIRDQDTE